MEIFAGLIRTRHSRRQARACDTASHYIGGRLAMTAMPCKSRFAEELAPETDTTRECERSQALTAYRECRLRKAARASAKTRVAKASTRAARSQENKRST